MRIAVYSGSFDPLHIGHQAIMERLTETREFDWVYLVISPQNPLKDPAKALSAERRCPPSAVTARPSRPSGAIPGCTSGWTTSN